MRRSRRPFSTGSFALGSGSSNSRRRSSSSMEEEKKKEEEPPSRSAVTAAPMAAVVVVVVVSVLSSPAASAEAAKAAVAAAAAAAASGEAAMAVVPASRARWYEQHRMAAMDEPTSRLVQLRPCPRTSSRRRLCGRAGAALTVVGVVPSVLGIFRCHGAEVAELPAHARASASRTDGCDETKRGP